MNKVCVYGVGAIGGLLAARLAQAGYEVTGIARGAQLAAIQQNGLTLIADGRATVSHIRCVADPAQAGVQDLVIFALKAHALPNVAANCQPLLGPATVVLTAVNGLPWWYFCGLNLDQSPLNSVDPGGRLWTALDPGRALGTVVFPAARVTEPGCVEHVFGERFVLGEPDGSHSERTQAVATLLSAAGFAAPISSDIRADIWTKLVANAAYNPVSLLRRETLGQMLDDPATFRLLEQIMAECVQVAGALGSVPTMSPAELLEQTRPLGAHKTSMLQDMEAGRSIELEPIVGAVHELAARLGVPTPTLGPVLEQARLVAQAGHG